MNFPAEHVPKEPQMHLALLFSEREATVALFRRAPELCRFIHKQALQCRPIARTARQ